MNTEPSNDKELKWKGVQEAREQFVSNLLWLSIGIWIGIAYEACQ